MAAAKSRTEILKSVADKAGELAGLHEKGDGKNYFKDLGPEYDSPELAMTRRVAGSDLWRPESDIFTLGVLLAKELTGKLPAASGTALEHGEPWAYAMAVPEKTFAWEIGTGSDELDGLIAEMLSPDPGKRPDAARTEKALREFADREAGKEKKAVPEPAPAEPDLWPGDSWEWDAEALGAHKLTFKGRKVQFGKQGYVFLQEDGSERFITSSKCRMMNLVK